MLMNLVHVIWVRDVPPSSPRPVRPRICTHIMLQQTTLDLRGHMLILDEDEGKTHKPAWKK